MSEEQSSAAKPYANVNGQWPAPQNELPKLTDAEAIAAVKRLLRYAKVSFTGSYRIGTGNRYTWPRRGVYTVNPSRGWHSLVHLVSHWCHRRLHPGKKPHDFRHAMLEREMIQHVVTSGWLDGKLKRQPKSTALAVVVPIAAIDAKTATQRARYENVLERVKRWEQKERRAKTALAKLAKQRRYYERTLAV